MKRKYTAEDKARVLAMVVNEQLTNTQVSFATGIPASTVNTWKTRRKATLKVAVPSTYIHDAVDTDLMLDISNSLITVCHLAKECLQWRSKALIWSAKLVELQNILSSSDTVKE